MCLPEHHIARCPSVATGAKGLGMKNFPDLESYVLVEETRKTGVRKRAEKIWGIH